MSRHAGSRGLRSLAGLDGGPPCLPDNGGPLLLLAGRSVRALAAACRDSGVVPLGVDLFGDEDSVELCADSRRVAGLGARAVGAAFEAMLAGRPAPIGLVLGSGFEDRPGVIATLAARFALLGNGAAVTRRAKDPFGFAALCAGCGAAHPEVARVAAAAGFGAGEAAGWLVKRRGGSGGLHVRALPGAAPDPRRDYLQRRVAGRPVSALFAADGTDAVVIGFTEQWADPGPAAAFRYGGAVRPARPGFETEMTGVVVRLTRALGLLGLNSADFLVGRDCNLIEINPRPGATLDVFAPALPMRLHIDACRGALPGALPVLAGAEAACLAYAARDGRVRSDVAWPGWAADRQRPGPVREGAPLCTVHAQGGSRSAVARLARARAATVLAAAGLGAPGSGEPRRGKARAGAPRPEAGPTGYAS